MDYQGNEIHFKFDIYKDYNSFNGYFYITSGCFEIDILLDEVSGVDILPFIIEVLSDGENYELSNNDLSFILKSDDHIISSLIDFQYEIEYFFENNNSYIFDIDGKTYMFVNLGIDNEYYFYENGKLLEVANIQETDIPEYLKNYKINQYSINVNLDINNIIKDKNFVDLIP